MAKKTLFISIFPCFLWAIGIILPRWEEESRLSNLPVTPQEVAIDINIIDNFVYVNFEEVFFNRTNRSQEGRFLFPLPSGTYVSGFATWDGLKRIPGVIMEKKRAQEIYERLLMESIDPGLLLPTKTNQFSARIAPVPPLATKKVEIELCGLVPETDNKCFFTLPFLPADVDADSVPLELVTVNVYFEGRDTTRNITVEGIPLVVNRNNPKVYTGTYTAFRTSIKDDIKFFWEYPSSSSPATLKLYQEGDTVYALALLTPHSRRERKPITVAFMLDISASMSGEKFSQAFAVLKGLIQNLPNGSNCCVLAFNDSVYSFPDSGFDPPKSVLERLNELPIGWGTDLLSALMFAYGRLERVENNRAIVLISDGIPSVGEIGRAEIEGVVKSNRKIPFFAVGIGDDVDEGMLERICSISGGKSYFLATGENPDVVLTTISPFIGEPPIRIQQVKVEGGKIDTLYPEPLPLLFSSAQTPLNFIVHNPKPPVKLTLKTDRTEFTAVADSIHKNKMFSFVARLWAKSRVDYLLNRITLEGEKEQWVNEIIALSKRYTFVTPYTAFLAAPKTAIRPRVIQPRDPKVTVDAPYAKRVTVFLPWGERIEAVKNPESGLWEARFVVPQNTPDGEYNCEIVIENKTGETYIETKKILVDNRPPELKVEAKPPTGHPGTRVLLSAKAPQDTRTILAITPDGKKLSLIYSDTHGASIAYWIVPHLPPGTYFITFIATDFAGNQSEQKFDFAITE